MEGTAKSYFGWTFDDIVFDQRNKAYGAYDLRKTAKKNAGVGLLIAAGITAVLLIGLKIDWASLAPKKEVVVETSVTLAEPPPLNEKAPPPPPPPPPPQRPTVKFLEMVVKKNEEVKEEEPITEIKDIKDQEISTKTQEGDANAEPTVVEPVITEAPVVEPPKVFTIVEQMPEFPGGDAELLKFIQSNIQYPPMERDNDVQGRVIVGFTVNEDGSVSDVNIKRGVSSGLDKEATRVIRLLPKFKPGKQQGKAVKVYYSLPVVYKLQ